MAGSLRNRNSNDKVNTSSSNKVLDQDSSPSDDIEIYSKDVLNTLITDGLPATPNNFSLYFDRLLEDKSESFRKQIKTMLELEDSNDDENTIMLEQSLKQGFTSVKNILGVTATLYKNMSLMTKILEKRKLQLETNKESKVVLSIASSLEGDISKLNTILKKQSSSMKSLYDETATIVKHVENETIFDNRFGVYNKRHLMIMVGKEISLIKEFKHNSSLIMIELDRELKTNVNNEKSTLLMTRTIARLLLKTSRRSDTVAHYGNGRFAMLLKHTDLTSAQKASERLCELVSSSNFFLADREIKLKISIGITDIAPLFSVEEIIVSAMDGIEKAYEDSAIDYAVSLRMDKATTEKIKTK
jgi:diguanylate cyclase (GGDEF)-like protein